MKANIFAAALALCLIGAPVATGAVAAETGVASMPAKKTSKKSTKKTTKKTTKKSTSKTSKTTAKATTAKAEETTPAASNNVQEEATSSQSAGSSLLGGILGSVLGGGSSSSSSSSNGVLSALTTIFDAAKGASKNNIVGTWQYTEPAVVFSSNNALKNIGGKVASSAIEKQLEKELEKVGIKKGAMSMTFDKDGNFTQTIAGKTTQGTYSVKNGNVTLKYGGTVQQFVGTTQIDGNDLLIVMDASKLLKFAKTLGSLTGNSLLSTAGNLVSSMDGMQVGLKLNK